MINHTTYCHTQRAPFCLLLYALAILMLGLGPILREATPLDWVFPAIGLMMLLLAASFHHLTVADQGDRLAIGFGPIPLFRRSIKYADIVSVETDRTLFLDGWGIHMSARGGWVWNLWGRNCVKLQLRKSVLRVGTDDAEQLAEFLRTRIATNATSGW